MKLFQPRRTPHPTPEISKTPSTPVDKTDKTPPEVGFGGFVNAPQGGLEKFTPTTPAPLEGSAGPRKADLKRDPDPSGCPTHWQRIPELPPRGSRVAMVDESGFGRLYRFKHAGVWYLLKFLPPFDGRVSITAPHGVVRVLASLEEAALLLNIDTLSRIKTGF